MHPFSTIYWRRHISLLAILLVPLFELGCASMKAYEGPELPENEIAMFKVNLLQGFWLVGGVFLHLKDIDENSIPRGITTLELSPGLHTVRFTHETVILCGFPGSCIGTNYRGSMDFIAEPQHVYELHAELHDVQLWSWITDIDTGEVVAEGKFPHSKERLRAYEGPERPRNEVAVIKGVHHDFALSSTFHGSFISSVDGKRIRGDWADVIEIEVLPGVHDVSITSYSIAGFNYTAAIEFSAELGHVYQVDSEYQGLLFGNRHRFWITDTSNEKVVGETNCLRVWAANGKLTDCAPGRTTDHQ